MNAAKTLFLGVYPQCCRGKLFRNFLTLRERCDHCGCDFSVMQPEDGLAAFVTLLMGILVVPPIFILEVFYQPPYWVYIVFGLPLLLLTTLLCMRIIKAWLVFIHFNYLS